MVRCRLLLPVEYLDSEHYELDVIADGVVHYSHVFACLSHQPGEAQLQDMLRHGRQACIHLPFDQVEERPLRFVISGREMDRDFQTGLLAEPGAQFSVMNHVPLHAVTPQGEVSADVAPLLFVPANLALKGLQPVGLDINLIPPALRPRRRKSMRKLFIGIAALPAGLHHRCCGPALGCGPFHGAGEDRCNTWQACARV